VRNASYLKCSNITLGYSFAKLISEKISGRVYFTAQNPFIITKYKGIDPEVSSGIDNNPYPRPMSFQLGLNLNF
jgi:iron complex outermembrane receptor protein